MDESGKRWKRTVLTIAAIFMLAFVALQIHKYRQIRELYGQAIAFCSKVEKDSDVEKLLGMANANTEKRGLFVDADSVTVKFERSSGCIAELRGEKVSKSYVYYND
jgi:hypothetical protein